MEVKRNAYRDSVNKPEEKRYLKHLVETLQYVYVRAKFQEISQTVRGVTESYQMALKIY